MCVLQQTQFNASARDTLLSVNNLIVAVDYEIQSAVAPLLFSPIYSKHSEQTNAPSSYSAQHETDGICAVLCLIKVNHIYMQS